MKNKLALLPLLGLSLTVVGQEEGQSTIIQTEGKRYIRPAYKINEQPEMVDTIANIPEKEYPLLNKDQEVATEIDQIEAAKLKVVEPLKKLYNGYVRAGLGNYNTPLLDFHYMETKSRVSAWGVNLHHLSSRDAHEDYGFSGFSDNNVKLYGKKFMSNYVLSGDVKFDYLARHNYGYFSDSVELGREASRQRYYNYELNSRLTSYFEDSLRMNKDFQMGYYYFRDHKAASDSAKFDYGNEHGFNLRGAMGKYFNKEYFSGDLGVDFISYKSDTLFPCVECDTTFNTKSVNNAIFDLGFQITTRGKWYSVKAGLRVNADIPDALSSNAAFYIYPDVEVRFNLFHSVLMPYVGLDGGLQRNSYKTLAMENPFMLSGVDLMNTNNSIRFFGGMRGSFSSRMSFNIGVSAGTYKRLPLFIRDTTYSYNNRFDVVYDTMSITSIHGQLSYHKDDDLKIYAKGEYFIYGEGRELSPWYLPEYKFSLNAVYDMADKIIVRADVFVLGGRKEASYSPIEGSEEQDGVYALDLGTFVDANLGFEYRYTKRLSAFLNFSNILSKRYQMWQDYPVQGFQVLGGVTFTF